MRSDPYVDWKAAAVGAVTTTVAERLRAITCSWAAARVQYLTLLAERPYDVPALRDASRRYQEMDRARRRAQAARAA
ncbi:MAG: hypothetical protein WDO56_24270 [Gammaproteobacteria bacterium]